GVMLDRPARRVYLRLGRDYKLVFAATQEPAALVVATVAVLLITSYYDPSTGQTLACLGIGWGATITALSYALWRWRPYLARVEAWQDADEPTAEQSIAAWDAATNFPMRSFRANFIAVNAIAALPAIAAMTAVLHEPWWAAFVLLAGALPALGYATILNYFIAELLMRPVIDDIAARLPDDFPFTANGLLIRNRLKILLPIFTSFVGFVVAGLMTGHGASRTLGLSVLAAIGVGLVLSFGLTVLLSRSVTAPIAALRSGLARVRAGDYTVRVPVVTSDELGELSHDFNLMAQGLAEREALREAFGTYLDRDIVPLILSGQFPREGVEVDVSIMFVDV